MAQEHVYHPNPGVRQTVCGVYCLDCCRYRNLDEHGRCDVCQSNQVSQERYGRE